MILDKLTTFAEAVALSTSGTGEQNIGDVMDLEQARDIAVGEPLGVIFTVSTAFTSGGSATISFQIASDAVATLSVAAAQSYHGRSGPIPVADLILGYKVVIPLISGDNIQASGFERYLGIQANVLVAALTAGSINASLVPLKHVPVWQSYPDANN